MRDLILVNNLLGMRRIRHLDRAGIRDNWAIHFVIWLMGTPADEADRAHNPEVIGANPALGTKRKPRGQQWSPFHQPEFPVAEMIPLYCLVVLFEYLAQATDTRC
jgi:hypothetical protein